MSFFLSGDVLTESQQLFKLLLAIGQGLVILVGLSSLKDFPATLSAFVVAMYLTTHRPHSCGSIHHYEPSGRRAFYQVTHPVWQKAGISVDTICFYERKGLLQPVRVASNSYKHYDENSLQRLDIIIKSKQLGFTLSEIKALLDKLEGADFSLETRSQVVDKKLESIDKLIRKLSEMQQMLLKIKNGLTAYAGSGECSVKRLQS